VGSIRVRILKEEAAIALWRNQDSYSGLDPSEDTESSLFPLFPAASPAVTVGSIRVRILKEQGGAALPP